VLTKDSTITAETKSGKAYSFKGITSAQIVARGKAALISHGVLYTTDPDQTTLKVDGNKTTVWVHGTFENVDDPADFIVRKALGEGVDNAGNGFAKAYTMANKQILAKQLNMTTVDDDAPTEVQHNPGNRGGAEREAEATTDMAIKTWADAFKRALDGCNSLNELKRIRAENAHMMKNDKVADATKTYFIEKIAGLEGALS
jgi:ERF superfamily